ncbi:MAG: membrane protein insertase YidC [Helicobacteraceae bacterium]|nr:membrane protein insertase YidC [Helicobacteraceae bacterium]
MLEKMSPNQRLIIALALSFVFFIAYTTVFPPPPVEEESKVEKVALKEADSQVAPTETKAKANVGHEINSLEKVSATSSNTLVTLTSDKFTLTIDTLGRISSNILSDEKYFNSASDKIAQMITPNGAKPLQIRFADDIVNNTSQSTPYTTTVEQAVITETKPVKVVLTQTLPEVTIEKTLTFFNDGHYDVAIKLSNDKRYFVYLGQRPNVSDQMMTVMGNMIYAGDGLTTIYEDGDVEGRTTFNDVHLLSAFDQYYANIFYNVNPDVNILVERDRDNNPITYMDGSKNFNFSAYSGPKNYVTLKTIDPVLVNAIEYGWFTFAAKPLFAVLLWLNGIFGNWGWAIIALTIIVRILLYPLTYKGMLSMAKLKDIAPKVKEVQAKYKGDPQRMNVAVMDMYKKHGANPLGGCLPLLLQIPVFFAIYRVLLNAVELQGAPWIFWITDLAKMDPTYILPIFMGATMYYQQKITPNNFTDPLQEKVFKFLPVIFTFFFITFPAGLVLYWAVNNILSIAQQFMVNKAFDKMKKDRHEQHLAEKHHGKDKEDSKDKENGKN